MKEYFQTLALFLFIGGTIISMIGVFLPGETIHDSYSHQLGAAGAINSVTLIGVPMSIVGFVLMIITGDR